MNFSNSRAAHHRKAAKRSHSLSHCPSKRSAHARDHRSSQRGLRSASALHSSATIAIWRFIDLKEEGPYGEYIKHWVIHQKDAELIRLRPMLPWKMRLDSNYTLTPEETSRLLIESFLAIAADRNIDFLVEAILLGNPQNRYALFGLLMRATNDGIDIGLAMGI